MDVLAHAAARRGTPGRLTERHPHVPPETLLAEFVPPPRFAGVRFSTYRPDPAQPSQAAAVEQLELFGAELAAPRRRPGAAGRWFARLTGPSAGRAPQSGRGARTGEVSGRYLDGGFGVGKTHLLASLWHTVHEAHAGDGAGAAFGTFVEYTNLVGALGFRETVERLSRYRLVCIDEFELDDPGDTVLMSRLMSELDRAGVALAATSNTLPDALGEGRFAAEDFRREIQALASRFVVLKVDGEDYRHRGLPPAPPPLTDEQVVERARATPGATLDGFTDLLDHLAAVHPSRYGAMLDGVQALCLTGVTPVTDQSVALRLVVLADRLYDRDLPVVASGAALDTVFGADMLAGGYRKKYRRALSRLMALAREASGLTAVGEG